MPAGRTIPTHVGRTRVQAPVDVTITDHPHARGENKKSGIKSFRQFGPSPRTWGERAVRVWLFAPIRTVPTHVGRTRGRATRMTSRTDYPHARGENTTEPTRNGRLTGPSPRTWGEQEAAEACGLGSRTIPTHVGRTVHRSRY